MPDNNNQSSLSMEAPSYVQNQVFTYTDRLNRGINRNYVDTYNEAIAADVQTALAEYFYNKYQSPAAMARQYEEAGLNRNFAQSGNSPVSVPKANPRSNVADATAKDTANTLNTINTIIGLVNSGVSLLSDISGLPKDLAYKQYRNILTANQGNESEARAESARLRAMFDSIYYGGVNPVQYHDTINGIEYIPESSPAFNQASLRNDLMKLKTDLANFDLNNLKPEELKSLTNRVEGIITNNQIAGKTLQFFDASKIASIIIPLLSLIKFM